MDFGGQLEFARVLFVSMWCSSWHRLLSRCREVLKAEKSSKQVSTKRKTMIDFKPWCFEMKLSRQFTIAKPRHQNCPDLCPKPSYCVKPGPWAVRLQEKGSFCWVWFGFFLFLLGVFLGFLGVVLWLVVVFGCFFLLIFLLQTIFIF